MIVRKLNKEEIKEASEIYKESFGRISKKVEYINDNIYIVTEDDRILGLCTIDYIDDIFNGVRRAYLNSVCVSKKYRDKGVATFMLKEVEKMCKEDGAGEIILTSTSKRLAANHLYKKLHYIIRNTNLFSKKID